MSIPESDIEFLDEYAKCHSLAPRPAALQQAIQLLKANEMSRHYAAAFAEWAGDAGDRAWDDAIADGLIGD